MKYKVPVHIDVVETLIIEADSPYEAMQIAQDDDQDYILFTSESEGDREVNFHDIIEVDNDQENSN